MKVVKTGFPEGTGNLRKRLTSAGFREPRVWEGEMLFAFLDTASCIENLNLMGGDQLLNLGEGTSILKEELDSILQKDGHIQLRYNYLGSICSL
jgi:hypothetical protein